MIVPVRCYSCGKVIADVWRDYQSMTGDAIDGEDTASAERRAAVLDGLGLTRLCCRRMLLSQPSEDLLRLLG